MTLHSTVWDQRKAATSTTKGLSPLFVALRPLGPTIKQIVLNF